MDNRQITDENLKETGEEKYPNRYKPGQSGNPSGRPKKTKEDSFPDESLISSVNGF